MPTLEDIAGSQTGLDAAQVARLQELVGSWQIIADLAFCDLVLWVGDAEEKGLWAAAQIRPTTGPTTLLEDVVGTFVPRSDVTGEEVLPDGSVVDVEVVDVGGPTGPLGIISLRRYREAQRSPSALEQAYLQTSAVLIEMVRAGQFPLPGERAGIADSLRVGDGLLRIESQGTVTYASPNALSAYRRLGLAGDLVGRDLVGVTTALLHRRPTDRGFAALFGRAEAEAEIEGQQATVLMRIIPLISQGEQAGYLVLLRDVTELRVRERELVSKEATIREIHHRVKNNLQTVAALLRLQSRRLDVPEAKDALLEAERRVGSIALVHETLSQSFDETVPFDAIADTLLRTLPEFADGVAVHAERVGSFGALPGDLAMSLAMVLTELVQNAVEHAFTGRPSGRITVAVNRVRDRVRLRISDDGHGLPEGFDAAGSLGLSIVATLVEGELNGTLEFDRSTGDGAAVTIAFEV